VGGVVEYRLAPKQHNLMSGRGREIPVAGLLAV